MNLASLGSVMALAGGLFAFCYGLYRSMNGVGALYFRILTFAVGCFTLGRLYEVLYMICVGELTAPAHIGQLGTVTMSLFLMTANRGTLDDMLDDRRKELRKYRIIPILFPVLFACVAIPISCIGHGGFVWHLISGIVGIVMMITVYFEGKHLLFPDEGLMFAESTRLTNAAGLVFNLVAYVMLSPFAAGTPALYFALGIVSAVCVILMICSADRGVKRWQT